MTARIAELLEKATLHEEPVVTLLRRLAPEPEGPRDETDEEIVNALGALWRDYNELRNSAPALLSRLAKLEAVERAAREFSTTAWRYVGVILCGDERIEGQNDFVAFTKSKDVLDAALAALGGGNA